MSVLELGFHTRGLTHTTDVFTDDFVMRPEAIPNARGTPTAVHAERGIVCKS